jgi:hypothetical protein
MKYFELETTVKRKYTGKTTKQCKNIPNNAPENWLKGLDATSNFSNNEPIKYENKLIFELENDATLTDAVSVSLVSSKYILVNERLMGILKSFNIPYTSIHKAKVISLDKTHDYYYIHFYWTENHGIDYNKSKFYYANSIFENKIADIEIKSYQDYLEKSNKLDRKGIYASEIYLDSNFNADIFGFRFIVFKYLFISERLKKALVKNKITGFDFTEQKHVHEFSVK